MVQPVSFVLTGGGITNQKLGVLGLLLAAKERATPMVLPRLVNFFSGRANHPVVEFETIFDAGFMAETAAAVGIEIVPWDDHFEPLDALQCFGSAAREISQSQAEGRLTRESPVCRLLAGFKPAPAIHEDVQAAAALLQTQGVEVGSQFRIEHDWLRYSAKVLKDRLPGEDYCLTYLEILEKIHAYHGSNLQKLYVTCNESDIPVSKEEITRNARETFDYELVWKSDVIEEKPSRNYLESALIDFELACSLKQFTGLSRSTFFNNAGMSCYARGWDREFFLYNTKDKSIMRRYDNGAFANAQQATRIPATVSQ